MDKAKIIKILEKNDFTSGEAKVYVALLSWGLTTIGNVVKNSGISRSKVYDILERLSQKGLVSKIMQNKIAHYEAESPTRITRFLEEKEKEIAKQKEELNSFIPNLENIYKNKKQDKSVQVFMGKKGLKNFFENILELLDDKEEYIAFSVVEVPPEFEGYLTDWADKLNKNKIKIRAIFNENANKKRILEYSKQKFTRVKIIEKEFDSPAVFNVYKNKVGILIWTSEPLAIIIENKEVAKSFKRYFEIIWKHSKNLRTRG